MAAATGTLFDAGKPDRQRPSRTAQRPARFSGPRLSLAERHAAQWELHHVLLADSQASRRKRASWTKQKYTPSRHVTPQTPTTFIYSTTDDRTVPISASVDFYNALIAAGVPAELHIFRHGDHGSGMGAGNAALDLWPVLLEQWLRDQGLLTPLPKP